MVSEGQGPTEERRETPAAPPEAQPRPEEAGAPTPEHLEAVQEAITLSLEGGAKPEAATEILEELRPPDQAEVIVELEPEAQQALLGSLAPERIADILEHMDVADAVQLSGLVDVDRMAQVLERAEPDVAADVLRGIGWADASRILMRMKDRQAVSNLLLYQDDAAGGLMTTNVVALRDTWPVPHAINMLRTSGMDPDDLRQLFVVSSSGQLVGELELADLVFAPPGSAVRDVMDPDVISVETGTDQEDAARLMQRYELRSLPVVDANGRLEGAISVEDVLQVAEEEATEDMFLMASTGRQDTVSGPVRVSVRSRLPWLLANIGAVSLVASVLGLFDHTLDSLAVLVVYMPMVMNQAGVTGTQVTTVVVRALALGEVSSGSFGRLLRRELLLAAINGGVVSAVMATVVGLWRWNIYLALVVLLAMLLSYFVAAAVGVLVPMTMRRLEIDPATASGVVLTTFTDITGGASYLAFATLFLALLTE